MDGIHNLEFEFPEGNHSRPHMAIVAAVLVMLVFFLVPIPQKLLDILWICTFFLAGAVSIICFAVRSSSDLSGFLPMTGGLIFVRLITQSGTAGHIFRDEPAGFLLAAAGSRLASGGPLWALGIGLVLALAALFVVFSSCRKITRAVNGYFRQILPLKCMGLKTDLRLGVINQDQARELALRVASESRFYAGINRLGWLMRTEAALCILTLLACLLVPASNKTIAQVPGVDLLSAVAPSVAALSLFSLVPIIIVSVACGILMNRNALSLHEAQQPTSPEQTRKIKVVALDSDLTEDSGLINPDFIHHRSDEKIVEFEPHQPADSPQAGPVLTDISCRNAKEYYEKLSRVICAVPDRPRVLILASDKVHSLPVTVAVNIAIRLAQKKKKVLLLDTDEQRNAVGNVFDLNAEAMRKKVQSSSLENLSVGCVPAPRLHTFLQKDKILGHFDTTLIYTPNLESIPGGSSAESARPGAFYFIENDQTATSDIASAKLAFCRWMCLIPSIQSVLETRR